MLPTHSGSLVRSFGFLLGSSNEDAEVGSFGFGERGNALQESFGEGMLCKKLEVEFVLSFSPPFPSLCLLVVRNFRPPLTLKQRLCSKHKGTLPVRDCSLWGSNRRLKFPPSSFLFKLFFFLSLIHI